MTFVDIKTLIIIKRFVAKWKLRETTLRLLLKHKTFTSQFFVVFKLSDFCALNNLFEVA